MGQAGRAGARAGGGDQIWLRAAGGRDVACRAREGDRRLLPARLLRDLRLLFEDDLQRAAALRSSAGEQRPDRDRIGGALYLAPRAAMITRIINPGMIDRRGPGPSTPGGSQRRHAPTPPRPNSCAGPCTPIL